MKTLLIPILFAVGTAICWGFYGPVVANARSSMKPPLWSPFKPYVGIGMAYIVFAFIGGLIAMKVKGDSFTFTGEQSAAGTWGFAAGTLGALGALSLTSAMLSFAGPPKAQLVMPIVFGGAVSITAIVSVIQVRLQDPGAKFNLNLWLGIAVVLVGIVLVASNTPHPTHAPKKDHAESETSAPAGGASDAAS